MAEQQRRVQGGRRVGGRDGCEVGEVVGGGGCMSTNRTVQPQPVAEAVFIPFEDLKRHGVIPRRGHNEGFKHALTGQANAELCRPKSSFDASKTLFLFVSHRWLSPGGADGHPDNREGVKHALIVEAVEKLLRGKHMKAEDWVVAVWIDYGCVDQDLENPAAELDELHEIIAQVDVVLTPVYDPGHADWEYPRKWFDFHSDYRAPAFQEYWGR